jgi:hypothetical protein
MPGKTIAIKSQSIAALGQKKRREPEMHMLSHQFVFELRLHA